MGNPKNKNHGILVVNIQGMNLKESSQGEDQGL